MFRICSKGWDNALSRQSEVISLAGDLAYPHALSAHRFWAVQSKDMGHGYVSNGVWRHIVSGRCPNITRAGDIDQAEPFSQCGLLGDAGVPVVFLST